MHRLAVKSNLVDSGSETTNLGLGDNELPLCPKPRRLGSATSEILKPLRCNKHRFALLEFHLQMGPYFHVEFNYVSYHVLFHVISQPNMDGRSGVVSMITEKVIHLTGICICIFRSMAMNWVIHLKRHMFWCRQCAVGA